MHVALWRWLEHNYDKEKSDWPGWKFKHVSDLRHGDSTCFACEENYERRRRHPKLAAIFDGLFHDECVFCPIFDHVCTKKGELYGDWLEEDGNNKDSIAYLAGSIADLGVTGWFSEEQVVRKRQMQLDKWCERMFGMRYDWVMEAVKKHTGGGVDEDSEKPAKYEISNGRKD